jgi:hypothetical protein
MFSLWYIKLSWKNYRLQRNIIFHCEKENASQREEEFEALEAKYEIQGDSTNS